MKNTRTRGRLANSARSKRQQHLETLRRRRAGDKAEESRGSEAESESEDPEAASEAASDEDLLQGPATATLQSQLIGEQDNSDV